MSSDEILEDMSGWIDETLADEIGCLVEDEVSELAPALGVAVSTLCYVIVRAAHSADLSGAETKTVVVDAMKFLAHLHDNWKLTTTPIPDGPAN